MQAINQCMFQGPTSGNKRHTRKLGPRTRSPSNRELDTRTEPVPDTQVIRKSYPASKSAIAAMRRDVAALVAEYLGADREAVENVKLAVSEAATWIVRSLSFEENARQMRVAVACPNDDRLAVIVSDDSYGAVQPVREAVSISFMVMRDCTDALKLHRTPTGGIEIDMSFALHPDTEARRREGEDSGRMAA